MADRQFRTEVVADPNPYKGGMDQVARITQETAQTMATTMAGVSRDIQGTMDGMVGKVTATFGKLQSIVIGAGAAIASGGMFGQVTTKTVELAKEQGALSRALGISQYEAGVLNIALGDIFQSSDKLLTANRAMTRELRENEEAIRKLGVETRNSSTGGFRNALDIILDVNKALGKFTEGTDRNLEGQKAYKKAWEEVAPILKLNTEVLDAARDKADKLGLTMSPEVAEMIRRYRAAMNDVDDVLKAMSKTASEVAMPVLTELGNWFAETGPERVGVMRMAIASFVAILLALKGTVEVLVAGMVAPFSQMAILLLTVADMVGHAITGKWSEIPGIWRRGTEQMADVFTDLQRRVERNMNDIGKVIANGFNVPTNTFPTPPPKQGKNSDGGEDKNLMQKWEAELKAQRDAYDREQLEQGSFQQFTLEMESTFWKQKMDMAGNNTKVLLAVTQKYYDVERQIRKAAFEGEVAELKGRMAAAETSAEERINLATKVAEMEAQRFGRTSKQYKDALAEVQKAVDAWAAKQREIRQLEQDADRNYQLSRVELERTNLETLEQLGIINGREKVQRLRELKEIEYQIEQQALDRRIEQMRGDPTTDPVKVQEALNKVREIKEKHNIDLAKLDGQLLIEQRKFAGQWIDPIADGFQQMINGVIQGTRKWTDVVKGAVVSIAQQYLALGVRVATDWIKTELIKTQATTAAVAIRTAAESTGAAASTATTGSSAIANIGSKAWEAAASVYASIAQIPYVGPFLAPAMAIAAAAMILGFIGNIAKASGGFDVPIGANPITQLHSGEMVLPQKYADLFRGMADGGGGLAPAPTPIILQGESIGDVFMVNKHKLARALRSAARGFTPGGKK